MGSNSEKDTDVCMFLNTNITLSWLLFYATLGLTAVSQSLNKILKKYMNKKTTSEMCDSVRYCMN